MTSGQGNPNPAQLATITALSMLTGGGVAAALGQNARAAAGAAQNETLNNTCAGNHLCGKAVDQPLQEAGTGGGSGQIRFGSATGSEGDVASGVTQTQKNGANRNDAGATTGKTTVYTSTAPDGTTQYVGITDNLTARAAAHISQKGIEVDAIPGLQGISRADARAVEQVLIESNGLGKNGGSLMNKINSIAESNPAYAGALIRGAALLKSVGYPGF
ncbi:VENN motif pre-toxin domain-containing protein [Cupriavidus pauculus]|uniref:VENN motif pre-toxin domain-containing protein n=1 Tax=Cupriavidus pauculus TaxID=82633 RepID=UPI0038573B08